MDTSSELAQSLISADHAEALRNPRRVDERYVMTIKDGHDGVRLRDLKTGEARGFTGSKALYDALGVLADWRDRDLARGSECGPGCTRLAPGTEHTHGEHEGVFVTPSRKCTCKPHPLFGHEDGCLYEGMGA